MKTPPWRLLEGKVFGCQLQLSVRLSQKSGLLRLKTYNFRGKVVSQIDDPVLETSETRYRFLSSSVVVALFFSFFDSCFSFRSGVHFYAAFFFSSNDVVIMQIWYYQLPLVQFLHLSFGVNMFKLPLLNIKEENVHSTAVWWPRPMMFLSSSV